MDDPQLADQLSSSLLYLATRKVRYEDGRNIFNNRAKGEKFEIDKSKFDANAARCQNTVSGKTNATLTTSNATICNPYRSETEFHSSRRNRVGRQEQKSVVQGQRTSTKTRSTDENGLSLKNNYDFMVPTNDLLKRLSAESGLLSPRNIASIFNSRDFDTKEEQDKTRNSITLVQSYAIPAFASRSQNPTIESSNNQRMVGRMPTISTKNTQKDRFRRPPFASVNLKSDTNGEGDRDHEGNRDHGSIYSSSESGTEGGYAGSASSNDNTSQKGGFAGSSSSETHDFSSGASDGSGSYNTRHSDSSFLLSSSSNMDRENSSDDQDDSFVSSSRSNKSLAILGNMLDLSHRSTSHVSNNGQCASQRRRDLYSNVSSTSSKNCAKQSTEEKPPILMASCDVMAHVLTFLEPPQILNLITMPISRDWRDTFCHNQELWRILVISIHSKRK